MKAKIGLFGFGVVGQGFYQILAQKNGTAPGQITRICVRDRTKIRPLPPQHFTFDAADILDDPEITHVVELTDQPEAAYHIVRTALQRGKIVISANKKMLSERVAELSALQRGTSGTLLYEASACGSIPIFRNLEHFYAHDEVQGIQGIFNGSTNFVLTQMTESGLGFAEALAQAQACGFAETDPSLDIDAHDPAAKLALLTAHALGHFFDPQQVFRFGIRTIASADIDFAAAHSRKIRLLAKAQRLANGAVRALVIPSAVPAANPFFALGNEYNGVLIESRYMDTQLLTGKGAGGYPTGFAVWSDLVASTQAGTSGYATLHRAQATSPDQSWRLRVYLRFPDPALRRLIPGVVAEWERQSADGLQLIGHLNLQDLVKTRSELLLAGAFVAQWEA